MKRISLPAVVFICLASLGLIVANVSAEEIRLPIAGGVYHMISVPYMPIDRDPHVSLADDLGSYNKTQWRLFRYDPAEYKYKELKAPDWTAEQDFDFGRGYWLVSRSATEIDVEGTPVGENSITLEHEGDGWNQIGNILDYDFPIVSLYVARESTPLDQKQLINEANNDLTYVTFQEFENGSYIDIPATGKTTLEVAKAYWLRVREGVNEDVILWFVVRGSSALSKETHLTEDTYLTEEFLTRVDQQEIPPDPPPSIESSSSLSFAGSSSGGGCFIATAAYTHYDHPKVQPLREFRDQYLLTNSFGKIFVDIYYHYSPRWARFVAKHKAVKALVRFTLLPVAGFSALLSKMDMSGFLVVFSSLFFVSFLLVKKGVWGECKPKFLSKSRAKKREK